MRRLLRALVCPCSYCTACLLEVGLRYVAVPLGLAVAYVLHRCAPWLP